MNTTVFLTQEPKVDWTAKHFRPNAESGEFASIKGSCNRGEITVGLTVASARVLRDELTRMLQDVDAQADAARFAEEAA